MNTLSILYRVFYDKKLAVDFIKNGTGRGGKVLFVLAVVAALRVAVYAFGVTDSLKNLPVSEMAKDIPEIVFKNDRIISPVDYYAVYSDEKQSIGFVLDTTSALFVPSGDRSIVMRKDALVFQDKGEVRILPYQKLLQGKSLTLNRENMEPAFKAAVDSLRMTFPPVLFALAVPVIFVWYVLFSYFYGGMSYLMTYAMRRELQYDERIRLAVLSMMPCEILNILAALTDVNIRLGGGAGVLLTLIYMFCFLKEEKEAKTV